MSNVTWIIPGPPVTEPSVETEVAAGKIDHVAAALARLPEQFKRPGIIALLTALVRPAQALEDALWQLLTERGVDSAIGTQLDIIGEIVGQARGGLNDTEYRRLVRARIMVNRSRGTIEDVIRVARLLVLGAGLTIEVDNQGGAGLEVRIVGGPTTDTTAALIISFLDDTVAGGVRVALVSLADDEVDTFRCAYAAFATTSLTVGMTSFAVYDVDMPIDPEIFPASGSLIIDQGTTVAETVTYTAVRAEQDGSLTILGVSALTQNHSNVGNDGACVQRSGGPGLGFGDSADAGQPNLVPYSDVGTTGGRMVDARN